MYEPGHFKVEDRERIRDVIRAHPLGLLINVGPDGPVVDPLPFVLVADGGRDVLRAHCARANPQWRLIGTGAPVVVVFQGVDAYVSPAWYPTKRETGKVVPTWNYVIVQVRGQARIDESPAFLRPQIEALTRRNEAERAEPWAVDDAPLPFVEAQMRAIVGIEIVVDAMSAKFKLSQNRSQADRAGVVAGLDGKNTAEASAMARLVEGGHDGR